MATVKGGEAMSLQEFRDTGLTVLRNAAPDCSCFGGAAMVRHMLSGEHRREVERGWCPEGDGVAASPEEYLALEQRLQEGGSSSSSSRSHPPTKAYYASFVLNQGSALEALCGRLPISAPKELLQEAGGGCGGGDARGEDRVARHAPRAWVFAGRNATRRPLPDLDSLRG